MQERMQILNLLEEGKVSVDEAVRLLQALGGACCKTKDEECCDSDSNEECCESDTGDEPTGTDK